MIYPAGFLSTLHPEERALLTRARRLGVIPWRAMPSGNAGALDLQHMPLNNGGATGITLSTQLPDGTTRALAGFLRSRIRSGAGNGNTAGWFGIGSPPPGLHLCAAFGWAVHWISGGAISVVGRSGHVIGDTFAADGSLRPERIVGGCGWVKIQDGNPPVWRWYAGVPGVTEAMTGGAVSAADDRLFARAIGVPAQDPSGPVIGRAIMVDLSDRDAPVVVDRRTFSLANPANPKGIEWNHSPEDAPTGGSPLDLNLTIGEGSFGVRSLL